jgi:hypothetical protein
MVVQEVTKGTTPVTTNEEYAAAVKRAQAKGLEVTAVWDRSSERTVWQVFNPKSGSIHYVAIAPAGHLSCDCASRKYCCCRAAVREHLVAERVEREARHAAARAAATKRDQSFLASHAPAAFSIFK